MMWQCHLKDLENCKPPHQSSQKERHYKTLTGNVVAHQGNPLGTSSSPLCSSSDPAICCDLGKQRKMARGLGFLLPCRKPIQSSWPQLRFSPTLTIVINYRSEQYWISSKKLSNKCRSREALLMNVSQSSRVITILLTISQNTKTGGNSSKLTLQINVKTRHAHHNNNNNKNTIKTLWAEG